jgi:hypothetical protein
LVLEKAPRLQRTVSMNARGTATLPLLLAAVASSSLTFSNRSAEVRADVGDRPLVFSMSGARLAGPEGELHWSGDRLVGAYRNHDVELRAAGDRVRGHIGATAISFRVARTGQGFRMHGGEGESPIDLLIGPEQISGELGGCRFTLNAADDAYKGTRRCEPSAYPAAVTVRLPAALEGVAAARLAALLTLLLTPIDVVAQLEPEQNRGDLLWHRFGLRVVDAPQGAKVTAVRAASPAGRAGVERGLVVTRAGQEPIHGAKELEGALLRMKPSSTLTLQLRGPDHDEWLGLSIVAPAAKPLSNST